MDAFIIHGGRRLKGTVRVNGSKNAALPILIATLLTDEPCTIQNVPSLRDINTTYRLLEELGKKVTVNGKTVRIEYRRKLKTKAPYEIVKQMRASILVAGPLLARFGNVRVSLPGGCAIGLRPIDIHLKGFETMGAESRTEQGDVVLATEGLAGRRVRFSFPSVGATENLMMAAAATEGTTVIENAAREPEIEDLADFLNKLGATVTGAGGKRITVVGAKRLHGAKHRVIADRIETGTYLCAVGAAGGDVTLKGAIYDHHEALIAAMTRAGAKITKTPGGMRIKSSGRPRAVSIATKPHPGFPTDVQAPWMAYMALCTGKARVREAIFENRFMHAAELLRMGASIVVDGNSATVRGVPDLSGAEIMASDIRAGAGLIVAGLAAKGTTKIQRVYHIDRGYERIENVLRRLGAKILRVKE
jgi:UDP-N-acetylglucosamine 1-carboxyvinyltransferase